MGGQMCMSLPPQDTNEGTHQSDAGDTLTTRLATESKMKSTNLSCDPRDSFRRSIRNISKRKRLPDLYESHRFSLYVWSSKKLGFGHDSIVIGSADALRADCEHDFGYITAELCVDEDERSVFPNTRYVSKADAQPLLASKWKYQYSVETTLASLVDLVLALIANHGAYSNLHNGCHHFVEAFLQKIVSSEHERRVQQQLVQKGYAANHEGIARYRAHNAVSAEMKKQGLHSSYEPAESTLQMAGTALVLPVIGMALLKETKKSKRGAVTFRTKTAGSTHEEGSEDEEGCGTCTEDEEEETWGHRRRGNVTPLSVTSVQFEEP